MKVSELNNLYGFDVTDIKSIYKKHIILTALFVILDISLIGILTYFLFRENADFRTYIAIMFAVSLVSMFLYSFYAKPKEYNVCKFYNSIKNIKLEEETFDVNTQRLYSIIYCLGFKKIKADKDLDYYREVILDYCFNDTNKASKFYKYLTKYGTRDGDLKIYTVRKFNKIYFIDFIDFSNDVSSLDNEKENEDGDN